MHLYFFRHRFITAPLPSFPARARQRVYVEYNIQFTHFNTYTLYTLHTTGLLRLLCLLFLLVHGSACMWVFSGTLLLNDTEKAANSNYGGWITFFEKDDGLPVQLYIYSVYWAVASLTSTGYVQSYSHALHSLASVNHDSITCLCYRTLTHIRQS
jgi:hypothetical protein